MDNKNTKCADIADYLWYFGHIIGGFSIVFSRDYFELAVLMVVVGQTATILSRPIGRIKDAGVSDDTINKENDNNV
jgi:hypothetical protein